MKIIEIKQGTEEWLDWRKQGITATDAYTIMGEGFETPYSLWQIKTGKKEMPNLNNVPAVKYGHEHEKDARTWWENLPDHEFSFALPYVIEREDNSIFKASLDGYDPEKNLIIEFKCPMATSSTWKELEEKGEKSASYKRYWIQIQHQMMVADCDQAELVFYNAEANSGKIYNITRDEKFIEELKAKELEFWDYIINNKEPPKGDKDVALPTIISVNDYLTLINGYDKYSQEISVLKERIEVLEGMRKPYADRILDVLEKEKHKRIGVNGYNATLVTRNTTDYKKLIKDYKIQEEELAKYIKEGKASLKITTP